jgi:glyoxylase-like metal-dependent hydrolase (beta-lactamase superfamily II)
MKVLEDVYWYQKDIPFGGFIGRGLSSNVYVINQGDELWMIDTGVKTLGKAKRILRLMRKDGLNPELLTHIFLTHVHPDHVTGLPVFLKSNIQKPPLVGVHENEIPLLKGGNDALWNLLREGVGPFAKIFNPIPTFLIRWFTRFSSGPMPHYTPDLVFTGTQTIKGSRYNLDVIPLMGHSPGHCGYYLPKIQMLFAGDLMDFKDYDHSGINLPFSTYQPMVDSIEKVCSMQINHYCGGHFNPMNGDNEMLQVRFHNVLSHLYTAKSKIIDTLQTHEKVSLAELALLFPSTDPFISEQAAIPYAILKELIREGQVVLKNLQFKWIGN